MGHVGVGRAVSVRGAILAGGRATRLGGVAKGLLTVQGQRIIDRVHDALAAVADETVVVSGHADAAQWIPGLRVVPDLLEGGGSAAGVHAALRQSAAPVIVVAWDMPGVTPALLQLLADEGARGGSAHDAVVIAGAAPASVEPLCAWYMPPVADAIERGWARGDRRLHAALREVRCSVVERRRLNSLGGADDLLRNVNTADDLRAAAQAFAVRGGGA